MCSVVEMMGRHLEQGVAIVNPTKVFVGQLHYEISRDVLERVAEEMGLQYTKIYVVQGLH